MGAFTQSYLPLGDLWLTFEHGNLGRDYRRELRLGDAVASVRYRVGDVRYTREVIASHPAGVIAVRIAADRPGLVTFDARVASPLRHAVAVEDGVIRLRGVAPAHVEPSYYQADVPVQYGRDGGVPAGQWAAGEKPQPHKGRRTLPGMRFELAVGVVAEGGTVVDECDRSSRRRRRCRDAAARDGDGVQRLRQGSGARRPRPGPDRRAADRPPRARRAWPALRDAHVADHRALFDRLTLELPAAPAEDLPTDRRIAARGGIGSRARRAALPVRPLPADRVAAGPARSPPTCRASGTRTCGRRGARTTRSTSTPR